MIKPEKIGRFGQLYMGDCLEVMKELDDNSVDCVVTDPPYALTSGNGKGFMGKEWDGAIPGVDIWKEALRVSKPGAHLLAFGGTRTHHRLVCAIEDAGWEVRDCVYWAHSQGFPKSLNIGKSVDALQGNERESIGKKIRGNVQKAKANGTGYLSDPANKNNVKQFGYGVETVTKGNSEWEGFGTALKPAIEPIILCRKPIEKGLTIVANCLKWGAGGLAIDRCRVELNGDYKCGANGRPSQTGLGDNYNSEKANKHSNQGRFPSNLIIDSSEEVASCFPETKSGAMRREVDAYTGESNTKFLRGNSGPSNQHGDSGSAARFFQHCDYTEAERRLIYQAKPSRGERNKGCENLPEIECQTGCGGAMPIDDQGKERDRFKKKASNTHPTVKPLALLSYLIKLVIPPSGGIALDMFAGSGTTGVACEQLKIPFILIEKEAEYCDIIRARVNAANKPTQKKRIEKVKEKGQKQKGFFDLKKEGFV